MTNSIIIRGKKINYCNKQQFFKVVETGKWEPETFDVLDRFVVAGKSFIDCGSWVGVLSIYTALMGAKVYAIEPDHIAFSEMIENIEANGMFENIISSNLAISNANGMAQLNSNAMFGNSESSLVKRQQYAGEKTVRTKTLASFLHDLKIKDICLIKIDVEGSEAIIIDEGFRDALIEHDCPPVYISFHPAWLEPLEQNIQKFINVLFPIYDFESTLTKQKYTSVQFEEALKSHSDHSFLLTAKR